MKNDEPKRYEMTAEQIVFYLRKQRLNQLKEKRASGIPLTWKEQEEEDKIKMDLLSSVIRFGMKEAQKAFQNYRMDSEAYYDIQQALAEKFFEKLDDYDPTISTPTTFYVRHFKEVISNYLSAYTVHLSHYDIKNTRLVCRAINYFEANGTSWTEDMIANRTGLSEKVVHSTLRYRQSANYASIEDQETLQLISKIPSPEESYIRREQDQNIAREILETLNDEELRILILRLNLEDLEISNTEKKGSPYSKEKSFDEIHRETGLPLKDVKSIYNQAILKLGNNQTLCEILNHRKSKHYHVRTVSLQDHASSILEEYMKEIL